jgi:phosphatidylinositol alpha-1,6-mannosyltransferase
MHMAKKGWSVTVASPQDFAEEPVIDSFAARQPFAIRRLRRVPGGPVAKAAHRLAVASSEIRAHRPDVVLASGERMVWIAAALKRMHRVPLVAVGHALEFNVPARWQRALTRRSYGVADAAVCVSEYTWARMRDMGISPARGEVIPNGADPSVFKRIPADDAARFRREHDLEGARVLITLGSVHERKGQDVVIRALPHVCKQIENVHYVCIGYPHRRTEFLELAKGLGVADRVHFLGVVESDEVVRALNAADLFVMASQHTPNGDFEGYGIAVVEAALCGRAAVVSDNSGVCEAIEPGETGLTARVSDPESTAARIVELLSDPARLARMSTEAERRARTSKTWEHRADAYDALLRSVAAGRT